MIAQTVGRSQAAARPSSRFVHEPQVSAAARVQGVKFDGLGCTLAEWDLVAARMPAALRPSVRGGWNQSFSKAFLDWRRAGSPGPARPTAEPSGGPAVRTAHGQRRGRPAEIERAVVALLTIRGAMTVRDLVETMQQPLSSVYRAVTAMGRKRIVVSRSAIELLPHHARAHRVTRFSLAPSASETSGLEAES